ncbi:MAG TPA: cytochrome P450, partial [Micromonospora sp.]
MSDTAHMTDDRGTVRPGPGTSTVVRGGLHDIPAPGPLRQLKGLRDIRRDQVGYLSRLIAEYGDMCRIRLLHVPMVMVNHPDDVQRVLVDNHENYDKDTFLYRTVRPVLRSGLVGAVGGEQWHRLRRMMQPSFHRPKVATFVPTITDEAAALVRRWQRHRPTDVVDVYPDITNTVLRIVTKTLFGADLGSGIDYVERDFKTGNKIMGSFLRFPFPPLSWPTPAHIRLRYLIRKMDRFIDDVVRQREESGDDTPNLLGVLAAAVDDRTGYHMTAEQLHYEVINTMIGGYETTSNGVTWLLYQVARHPEVQRRLHAEIDEVLGDRTPTFDDLARLTYTRMVVDETLRLNSPAFQTMRRAIRDDVVGGYHIPAGTNLYVNFLLLQRNPTFWPDPERFDPDRFLPENVARRPRNAYLPFGSGPRICIGKYFGLAELQLLTAMLLQTYRIQLPDGWPEAQMEA